jgi:hypothetical protein
MVMIEGGISVIDRRCIMSADIISRGSHGIDLV